MDRDTKKKIIASVIMLLFFGSIIAFALISAIPGGTNYVHWHAKLVILIDNQQIQIPAGVGLTGNEEHPAVVHTHDIDNIMHKEGPDTLALGNFFEVWGKTFNSTCIFEFCNNEEKTVKMTVNGNPNTEFDKYIFRDQDVIVIDYS